jgi:hypothetical protein
MAPKAKRPRSSANPFLTEEAVETTDADISKYGEAFNIAKTTTIGAPMTAKDIISNFNSDDLKMISAKIIHEESKVTHENKCRVIAESMHEFKVLEDIENKIKAAKEKLKLNVSASLWQEGTKGGTMKFETEKIRSLVSLTLHTRGEALNMAD